MGCVSTKDPGVSDGTHTAPTKSKEVRPNEKNPDPPEVVRVQTSSCGLGVNTIHKQQNGQNGQERIDERLKETGGEQSNKKKKRKKKKKRPKPERKKDQPIQLCMFASAIITGSKSDNQLREMLKYMDIHETDDFQRQTSLMVVARCGKKNLTADLLSMGASIEAQNSDGQTALHLAAYFGYPDVVKQIVMAGGASCTNIQDNIGDTALHKCIQIEEIEDIVPHLIKAGANFDIKNNQGKSPLDVAPTDECKERVLKMINDNQNQNNKFVESKTT